MTDRKTGRRVRGKRGIAELSPLRHTPLLCVCGGGGVKIPPADRLALTKDESAEKWYACIYKTIKRGRA